MPAVTASPRRETILCLVLVTLLSFLTYVPNFWTPQAFFWDENYHIASAQKYLNRTFFMEPHPPLGKLVIAAGEALLNFNERDDQFIGTDYAKDPPPGFNFAGYRLFPALLAWLTAPILFLALVLAIGNPIFALLASFLYIFDTALIVHLRGAMLEPPYLFGSVLTILAFLLLREWKDCPRHFLC
ncbi:phospholipid carrier-dependent glycosyltransferase, partial [Candidatus Peregrinibacteria bacterium]|nr:phospholipid carrier-dependent glycosyltransferase [Candidatus Peregrinibacteria bacterium]